MINHLTKSIMSNISNKAINDNQEYKINKKVENVNKDEERILKEILHKNQNKTSLKYLKEKQSNLNYSKNENPINKISEDEKKSNKIEMRTIGSLSKKSDFTEECKTNNKNIKMVSIKDLAK